MAITMQGITIWVITTHMQAITTEVIATWAAITIQAITIWAMNMQAMTT